ncbi:hypothetical protein R5W24_005720 [Gemmata sp. JC717]|uniref:hypothetical protein n=1 Tax=Gemmata algarum TaxID=2975278 RepID=UPI0021BA57E6|nr:hypothetical protein [Gemmata algarum]MDY3556554.1 hypothetical protein [Gemmata algarum]
MSTHPAAPHGTGHAAPAHTDQPNWSAYTRTGVILAVVGWAVFAIAGFLNLGAAEGVEAKHDAKARFFVAYLSGYTYWLSLPIGALALLMIRYVAKTSWGLLLTRPLEAATRTLPLLVLFFLPIAAAVAFKNHETHEAPLSPYWWSNPFHAHDDHGADAGHDDHAHAKAEEHAKGDDHAQKDGGHEINKNREKTEVLGKRMLQKAVEVQKAAERKEREEGIYGFTSVPGFMITSAVCFTVWGVLIFFLNRWGKETSDATDPSRVDAGLEKLKNISSIGLVLYAIINTAACTMWVMSLEPGWSSTMFPVIFTVNTFLTTFAFCLALFLLIADRPPFKGFMRPKFQLDMATLMLVFTLFWSYTSFSQFMLIWIGNLPEEIPFYLKRSNESGDRSFWWYVSAALIALHFALPFLLLLFRGIKLHPKRLRVVALYLLVICGIDVIWWIAPSAPPSKFPAFLMDVGAVLGVGGLWLLYFVYQLKQRPIFPDNQAFLLPEGHEHGH